MTPAGAPASTSCCRCSRPTSRASSRRWADCPSRSACSIRRCTSSCPTTRPRSSGWRRHARPKTTRLRSSDEVAELEHVLERMRALEEGNPMLGTRGVRLGLLHPEIYEMQARAIFRAVRAVRARTGDAPAVEVMIPLVAYPRELELARALVERAAAEEACSGVAIGTMIELPRACLRAG